MATQTFVSSAKPVTLSQARDLMDRIDPMLPNHRNYFENSTNRKGVRVARSQAWCKYFPQSHDLANQIQNLLSEIAPQGSFRVSQSRKYPTFVVSIFYTSHSK